MEKKDWVNTLRAKLNIRPGEAKLTLLLFLYFFLITCPHTIIKTLRTTDLLVKMGVGALPLAYLSAALVTGLVVILHSKIQFKISIRFLIVASLVFFALSGVLLQVILQTNYGRTSAFLPYFYWVWASVLIIVLMTHFWMTVNEILNPREAKRLIGFISSGGIIGGFLGGAVAGFLTRANRAILLLPLACLLLFVCIFVVRAIFLSQSKRASIPGKQFRSREQPGRQKVGFRDSFHAVRKNSYLVLIAGIVAIGVIVSTLIEFQFFSAADKRYTANPKEMQAFLGFFFAALTIFAFLFNAFLTGNLLRKLKMKLTLLVTPVILLLGSLGILLTPFGLLPAILIKGSDESLAFSLNQSVREILYIPVFSDLKFKAKPFIDMFICRFAKVIAAIILLIFALLLNKELEGFTPVFDTDLAKNLSWIVIVLLIPWVVFSLKIGKEYLEAIKRNIPIIWDRGDKRVKEQLDVDYAKLIFDTMDSRSRSAALYAMHLFDLLEQDKLSPEIRDMISEKAGEVKVSSLSDLFNAEGATGFPETADDLSREDLVTNIREIMSLDAYQQLIQLHAERVIEASRKSEIEKMELAKAIGLMAPNAPLVEKLDKLISDDSPEVSCYAIKSAARLLKEEHLPAIIRKLGHPSIQEDAINALHKYGRSAVSALGKYLTAGGRDATSKRAAVEVLARIGTPEVVPILMRELERGSEELDTAVIDALDRVRSARVDIRLSEREVERKTLSLIQKYCRTFVDLQEIEAGEKSAERRRLLERNLETLLADIFKLMGLSYPHEDIRKAWQNLKSESRNSVAYAVELLDNTLKKEMKEVILPLVEDLTPPERLRRFQKILSDFSDRS
jgi:ATP/ADP translocase